MTATEFEAALLQRLAHIEPAIRVHVDGLRVLSREFHGMGSFTTFHCNAPADVARDDAIVVDRIRMPGVPSGMGAVLFCRQGKPECLEIYTYGEERWDGVHDGFVIE